MVWGKQWGHVPHKTGAISLIRLMYSLTPWWAGHGARLSALLGNVTAFWHDVGPCFPSGLLPALPGFCSLRTQNPLEPSTSCRHWFAHGHPDMDLMTQTWEALQLLSSVPEDRPGVFHLLLGIVDAWTYLCFLPPTWLIPVKFNRVMPETFRVSCQWI